MIRKWWQFWKPRPAKLSEREAWLAHHQRTRTRQHDTLGDSDGDDGA